MHVATAWGVVVVKVFVVRGGIVDVSGYDYLTLLSVLMECEMGDRGEEEVSK